MSRKARFEQSALKDFDKRLLTPESEELRKMSENKGFFEAQAVWSAHFIFSLESVFYKSL